MVGFNGLGLGLGALPRLSNAQTRSISPENFAGAKGAGGMATEGTGAEPARDLGRGWKVSPSVVIRPGETFTVADITGPGAIQQIWLTTHYQNWRRLVLRFYWAGQADHEIARDLGMPVGTVKVRLHRARMRLHDELGEGFWRAD